MYAGLPFSEKLGESRNDACEVVLLSAWETAAGSAMASGNVCHPVGGLCARTALSLQKTCQVWRIFLPSWPTAATLAEIYQSIGSSASTAGYMRRTHRNGDLLCLLQ